MKIKVTDSTAIQSALDVANGRATSHTATAESVLTLCRFAEEKLECVAKARRAGATATLISGRAVAKAYQYDRTVTEATVVRGSKSWYLTAARARTVGTSVRGGKWVHLTYEQTTDVLAQFALDGVGLTRHLPSQEVRVGVTPIAPIDAAKTEVQPY